MGLADDLLIVDYLESEVTRLRDVAFQEESDARKHRAKADALELEIVERRAASKILRDVGLSVGRDDAGVPWMKVERTLAPEEG